MDIGTGCCQSRLVEQRMVNPEPSRVARSWYSDIFVSAEHDFCARRGTLKTGGMQTRCQCQYPRPSILDSTLLYLGADCTPSDLSKRSVVNSTYKPCSEACASCRSELTSQSLGTQFLACNYEYTDLSGCAPFSQYKRKQKCLGAVWNRNAAAEV